MLAVINQGNNRLTFTIIVLVWEKWRILSNRKYYFIPPFNFLFNLQCGKWRKTTKKPSTYASKWTRPSPEKDHINDLKDRATRKVKETKRSKSYKRNDKKARNRG